MFATIKRGASSDGYFAVPLEGSSFFIPPKLLVQWNLREGQGLSEEQFNHYYSLQRQWACYEKGVTLLAMREHSSMELRHKLVNRDFSSEQINIALERLVADGYLDEQRYAQAFIRSRLRKSPEGRWLLARRLQEKGVPRNIVETVLDEVFLDDDVVREMVHAAMQKLSRKYDDSDRIIQELRKKGFSQADIRLALDD